MDKRETVTIECTDPMCQGVTSPDGKREYPKRDGKIELPLYEAERILKSGHPEVRMYRRSWAVGIDLKEMERKRREKEANSACG